SLFYARMEDRPQVFVTSIPDSLLEMLRLAQEKLRDTRVLDFDPASVTAISLAAAGQTEPLQLRRDDAAGWRIVRGAGAPELPADAKLVGTLLQRLSLLSATPRKANESPFLRDAPSNAEIETYGFNLPQREIVLTFAGSAPRLTLQLGASGGFVQARVTSQPFIYAVAADTLSDYPVAASFYRDRTLRTLPEGARITGLTLAAAGQPPLVSIALAEGQSWDDALAGETEARRDALKAVLAGLSTLRAKQFVNDHFTETTLVDGHPAPWKYTLEATLALGGATGAARTSVTTLQLAERAGGGTQLAGSKEFGVVFSIEQPLLDALWTLTYGDRDPGAPAIPAHPAPAP
ncbi:MAG TPA: DUF4340 domain-containing protein, partial [Luteolibacter sp.]